MDTPYRGRLTRQIREKRHISRAKAEEKRMNEKNKVVFLYGFAFDPKLKQNQFFIRIDLEGEPMTADELGEKIRRAIN